jgi:hypothetical protein
MKKNMGGSDKAIRLLIAAILIILNTTGILTDTLGWIALALAGILVVTSLIGFCPLYSLIGIHTCKKHTNEKF